MLVALTYLKGFNILIMRKPKFYIVESDVYCLWEKYDNFHFKLSEYSKKQFVWFNIQCNQVCSSIYGLKMAISYCRVITSMTLLSNIGGLLGLFFGFSGKRYFLSLKFINWMLIEWKFLKVFAKHKSTYCQNFSCFERWVSI